MIAYGVRDLAAARRFYSEQLGFEEVMYDDVERVLVVNRSGISISLAEGEGGETEAVAQIEAIDVKGEAERLRAAGVKVGTVLQLPGSLRLVDVFDPDGNRLQLTEYF